VNPSMEACERNIHVAHAPEKAFWLQSHWLCH
jgi:hypothetical protein